MPTQATARVTSHVTVVYLHARKGGEACGARLSLAVKEACGAESVPRAYHHLAVSLPRVRAASSCLRRRHRIRSV